MDRSTGPLKGYYIAVYACEMGELGKEHLGYFKVCRNKPESYWEADCVFKGCTSQLHASADQAMQEAENAAAAIIHAMPPAQLGRPGQFALNG